MLQRLRNFSALALALTLGLTACGSDGPTGPGAEAFNAAETQADLAAVNATYNTPAFQALAALGNQFQSPTAQLASASARLLDESRAGGSALLTDRARAASQRMTAAVAAVSNSRAPIIPDSFRGRVYVYDAAANDYVYDAARTDAPTDGMRFVIYAVDPVTDRPVEPLQEIGSVDVTDVGTDNSSALRIVLVSQGVTYADYAITGTGVFNAPVFEIDGFISDGTTQVNFTLTHAALVNIGGGTINIDYLIDAPSLDFSVTLELDLVGSEGAGTADLLLQVQHGGDIVELRGMLTNDIGTLEVFGNGQRFAIITVTQDGITAVNDAGEPLTEEERRALEELFEFVDEVFTIFDNLFKPVEWLFTFGQ